MIYRCVATNFTSGERRTRYDKQRAWEMRNRLPTKRYLRNLGRLMMDQLQNTGEYPRRVLVNVCVGEKIRLQHNLQDARHV
jgi:hypothetical protein